MIHDANNQCFPTRAALSTCERAKRQSVISLTRSRLPATPPVLLAGIVAFVVCGSPPSSTAQSAAATPARLSRVSPEDLHWSTISPTHTGKIHQGCQEFSDPEGVVSQGPITKVVIYHGGCVNGLCLWYGQQQGKVQGFSGPEYVNITEWKVPDGERITRIEGEIAGYYISRLQFFTDGGKESPQFGTARGKRFQVTDPAKGELRTISGWANTRRHRSFNRCVTSMAFHFGAPYFIKDINYDLAALEAAREKTAPEVVATQDIANRTSREQSSEYARDLEVEKTTTLTFEQSFGLTFGAKLSVEVGAGLKGVASANAQTELSWEVSSSAKSGREYKNSRREKVSWRVPVSVPPGKKIIATSTWRKYKVNIPFTYTVAWYEGTRDNIKKEVILPGVYNDTRVEDLKHDFKEAPLD
jgi:hypothetical protein